MALKKTIKIKKKNLAKSEKIKLSKKETFNEMFRLLIKPYYNA